MAKDLSQLSIDPARRERRGPGRRVLIAALAFAVLAVIVVIVVVAGGRRPVAVETAVVREAGSADAAVLNASGYVTPRRRSTVSAKVTGKIKDVLIDEGQRVEEGQVLARLDDADATGVLKAAEAGRSVAAAALSDFEVQLANARRTLERSRDLSGRGLVSQEALDNTETSVASLEAQAELARRQIAAAERSVEIARQDLENLVIRAPFAGIVVSKDAQPGEMVSPISAGGGFTRTGIATIVDMQSLEIEVDVNESYIARVTPGQRIQAALDAYPDWPIPASVRTVIPTADRQKATVKVRIAFDQLDQRILPDMGVKVSFLEGTPDSAAATALVAGEAVRADGDQRYVFVVKDGRAERRAVRTGRERGGDVEIEAGLRRGEQVVVRSDGEIRDGSRVEVRQR